MNITADTPLSDILNYDGKLVEDSDSFYENVGSKLEKVVSNLDEAMDIGALSEDYTINGEAIYNYKGKAIRDAYDELKENIGLTIETIKSNILGKEIEELKDLRQKIVEKMDEIDKIISDSNSQIKSYENEKKKNPDSSDVSLWNQKINSLNNIIDTNTKARQTYQEKLREIAMTLGKIEYSYTASVIGNPGIMTMTEWRSRRGAGYDSYEDYLDAMTEKYTGKSSIDSSSPDNTKKSLKKEDNSKEKGSSDLKVKGRGSGTAPITDDYLPTYSSSSNNYERTEDIGEDSKYAINKTTNNEGKDVYAYTNSDGDVVYYRVSVDDSGFDELYNSDKERITNADLRKLK